MTETGSLAKALAAFQGEMPTVAKSKTANTGTFSYTYAGLAEMSGAAMPLLSANGLAFSCVPEILDTRPVLTGILMHTSGESLRGSLPLATGGTPQQTGSAITYARRYLFGCMTGLITDDDDDGQLASQAPPKKRAAKKATRVTSTPADDPWQDQLAKAPGDRQVSSEQLKKMHASFGELNITDRDARLLYASDVVGRKLTTSNDLSRTEASKVIEALVKDAEAPFPAPPDPEAAS